MIELSNEERQVCEIWSRVMGYCRPVSSWNIGKKGEFAERKYFTEKTAARLIHGTKEITHAHA
ncbi:MAG: hypothetical protein IPN24_11240 [Betaproteobacteria bacterium]|nr:hypothetical protein [Betaproteobacteria bacterium]